MPIKDRREMIGWPGTITPPRMRALIKALETSQDPQETQILQDLESLIRAHDCINFSTTKHEIEEPPRHLNLTGASLSLFNLEAMTKFAWEQDTTSTIGGLISMVSSNGEREHRVIFKLLRHPEWTGYNPMLPFMKELNITISESHQIPGHPGLISGEPAEEGFPPGTITAFPDGQAELLASILRWHRAKEVRWRPQHAQVDPSSWYQR